MNRKRILGPALAVVVALAWGGDRATAQGTNERVDNIGYGTKAGEFLLLPVGGRATALGQAYSALADDATALYWNPAGIAFMRQAGAHVSHMGYVAETSYTWAGAAMPLGGDWVFGAQFGGFNFGEQPVYTVEQPDGTGATYTNSMFVAGLSAAMNVTERFSFGLTGKYVQESLANTSGSTFAVDVGTNYHTDVGGRPLRASFAILNLGGELRLTGSDLQRDIPINDPSLPNRRDQATLRTQPFALPVMFKVGVGYEAYTTPTGRLMFSGEFWQPQQNNTATAMGAEYMLRPANGIGFSAAVRGGWTYEADRTFTSRAGQVYDDKSSDGLTLGGGIGYRAVEGGMALSLDYAYRNLGLLGASNLFSVSLSW